MIVLGTRGSDLARAQTALVEAALFACAPDTKVTTKIITTRGDDKSGRSEEVADRHAGRKGLFTAEIERALLERAIDVAIHSAKDLPSDMTAGLEVCAALPRAQVEDVLIARTAADLNELKPDAIVATGSVRRQHQLRFLRPDLKLVDLRGNVPTRLRKFTSNPWGAIILARAGLERLGFDCAQGTIVFEGETLRVVSLSTDDFLPAGGQGIVALQIRSDDAETRGVITRLNHPETLLCLRAERELLRLLEGDCGTPVGVLATIANEALHLRAQVFSDPDSEPKTGKVESPMAGLQPESLAAALFKQMYGSKK